MQTKDPPDRDILRCQDQGSIKWALLRGIICISSAAALCLLGYFVIGPWLSKKFPPAPTTVAAVSSPDLDLLPSPHSMPPESAAPLPEVTIPSPSSPGPRPNAPSDAREHDMTSSPNPPESSEPPSSDSPEPAGPILAEPAENIPSSADSEPMYRVRAGVFADRANADALCVSLARAGFTSAVYPTGLSGRAMYSVQLGAFKKRENAEDLARALREAGFEATVTKED